MMIGAALGRCDLPPEATKPLQIHAEANMMTTRKHMHSHASDKGKLIQEQGHIEDWKMGRAVDRAHQPGQHATTPGRSARRI
eukprot:evm.model.NODE_16562_length_22072_cov_23.092787.4